MDSDRDAPVDVLFGARDRAVLVHDHDDDATALVGCPATPREFLDRNYCDARDVDVAVLDPDTDRARVEALLRGAAEGWCRGRKGGETASPAPPRLVTVARSLDDVAGLSAWNDAMAETGVDATVETVDPAAVGTESVSVGENLELDLLGFGPVPDGETRVVTGLRDGRIDLDAVFAGGVDLDRVRAELGTTEDASGIDALVERARTALGDDGLPTGDEVWAETVRNYAMARRGGVAVPDHGEALSGPTVVELPRGTDSDALDPVAATLDPDFVRFPGRPNRETREALPDEVERLGAARETEIRAMPGDVASQRAAEEACDATLRIAADGDLVPGGGSERIHGKRQFHERRIAHEHDVGRGAARLLAAAGYDADAVAATTTADLASVAGVGRHAVEAGDDRSVTGVERVGPAERGDDRETTEPGERSERTRERGAAGRADAERTGGRN